MVPPILGCLGRLHDAPAGDMVFQVAGQVKYTGVRIASTSLMPGKVSIYDNKGSFTLVAQADSKKTCRKFKLNKNIKQVTRRNQNFTLVLNDGFQVIAKDCPADELKHLEAFLLKIKDGKMSTGGQKSFSKRNPDPVEDFALFEEIKENIQLKKDNKQHDKSPFTTEIVDIDSTETPTKNRLIKKPRTKIDISESPVNPSSFQIITESSNDTCQTDSVKSTPLNKERNSLQCNAPSPTTPFSSRMKLPGGKSPLSDISKSRQRQNSPSSSPNNFDYGKANQENIMKLKTFYASSTGGLKKPSNKRRLLDTEATMRKSIQFGDVTSTPKLTQSLLSGEETTTHKPNNFYATSPLTTPRTFSGKTTGKSGSRSTLSKYTFHRREEKSSPSNHIVLTGFANLGNTCYMNVILQCLLGIPTFAQDLTNHTLLYNLQSTSLYRGLYNLYAANKSSKSEEQQRFLLRSIKKVISSQDARFSGYSQHDAHEFLGQCLDTLKEEKGKELEASCPIAKNFESVISHTIECKNCHERITREENLNSFSLDIPEMDENTYPDDKDLRDLLQDYFENESVGYKCDKCGSVDASLSHNFNKLPRVIILHLKRYSIDADSTKCKKKLNSIGVPTELNLGALCTEKTNDPLGFEGLTKSVLKQPSLSNEASDDDLFQADTKVRRRLSLPSEPRLTDPDEAKAETYDKELEEAKRLSMQTVSLDTMTEEEQLEWAMMESIKADKTPFLSDHGTHIPPDLLANNFAETKESNSDNWTVTEANKMDQSRNKENSNFTSVRSRNNADKPSLMEGISLLDSEDEQMNIALERSMQEFDQVSASKKPTTKRKLEENKSDNIEKKKAKKAQVSNAPPKKYRLLGIVSHMGDSSDTGHYISDVFDCKGKEWKSYNDSAVKKVTEYEVRYGRTRSAYIFFYIKDECFEAISK